ncbi:MAG: dephospho-CoA kinase [Candidatus Cloacimonadota bacterium]|nr:MAG: dephospho-CoA kinase [Candidatus Cloacimonadota bacterium]
MAKEQLLIGLTGNIATGKSTIANIFKEHGIPVIEADQIGWKLLDRKDIKEHIETICGDILKKGRIDRKKLGKVVFSNKEKLHLLNAIIHPPLLKELKLTMANSKERFLVVNAALIFEWGIEGWFDKILLVTSPDEQQIMRLTSKQLTRKQAIQRMQAQMPDKDKIERCDFIIENNGSLEELMQKTNKVIVSIKKQAL